MSSTSIKYIQIEACPFLYQNTIDKLNSYYNKNISINELDEWLDTITSKERKKAIIDCINNRGTIFVAENDTFKDSKSCFMIECTGELFRWMLDVKGIVFENETGKSIKESGYKKTFNHRIDSDFKDGTVIKQFESKYANKLAEEETSAKTTQDNNGHTHKYYGSYSMHSLLSSLKQTQKSLMGKE